MRKVNTILDPGQRFTSRMRKTKSTCDKAGLKISGLQSHGPLGRPEVHGEYIKLAIRVAAEIGVPVINTDEGIKAKWTTEEEDFVLIKYTLQEAAFVAERRGVKIGLEPGWLTARARGNDVS